MKNISQYSIYIIISILFASCEGGDKTLIKQAGEDFFTALVNEDLASAKQFVTLSTSEKWEDAEDIFENILRPETKTALQSSQTIIGEIKVDGNHAEADISIPIPSIKGEVKTIHFSKSNDGKWLIDEPGILVKEVIKENKITVDSDTTDIVEEKIE